MESMMTYIEIVIMLYILTNVYGQSVSTSTENTGCELVYHVLGDMVNQEQANERCIELGYDGLAIILNDNHKQLVDSAIQTMVYSRAAWVALEHYGPNNHDWRWKRNGQWLNTTLDQAWWASGQPDRERDKCAMMTDHGYLHSVPCRSTNFHPMCQKYAARHGSRQRWNMLQVYLKGRMYPNNTVPYTVRNLSVCSLMCTQNCQCMFTYYHGTSCYILTGSDVIQIIATGPGNYYRKMLSNEFTF